MIMNRINEIIEDFEKPACEKINEEIFRPLLKQAFQETPYASILIQEMGLTVLEMSNGDRFFPQDFFKDGNYPANPDAPKAFVPLMEVILATSFPYCYVTCPVPNDPWMSLTRENVLKYF